MTYIFKGKLWDKTENSFEPISNVMIKLYQPEHEGRKKLKKNIPKLIAQSKTDEEGNFVIEISDQYSTSKELQVDFHCEKLPITTLNYDTYSKINFKSLTINPGRSKLKLESFKMGTITFLSIFGAA